MNTIAQIKAEVDATELIGQYVSLRRNGLTWQGCCPFHSERTPSFNVWRDGHYHCFGCGAHGDIIDFICRIEGLTPAQAIARFKPNSNTPTLQPSPPPTFTPCHIPREQVDRAADRANETSLHTFLCRHFSPKEVMHALNLYCVGASRYENPQGGRAAALPYINASGEVVDVKIMHFSPVSGSRKDAPALAPGLPLTWALAQARQSHLRAPWCLFGTHLLPVLPQMPLAIVESEKTALIGALTDPTYLWLAAGGKANLTEQRLSQCKARQITLFPDCDAYDDWTLRAATLNSRGFHICLDRRITHLAQGPHDDIADIFLRTQ